MKEAKKPALTSGQEETYSKNRTKMGQEGMSSHDPKIERPGSPEKSGVNFSAKKEFALTEKQKQRLDNAWQRHNDRRIAAGERISPDELSTQKLIKERGILPPLTIEAAELVEKVKKGGIPLGSITSNFKRILNENGISDDQIAGKDPETLIKILSERRLGEQDQRVGVNVQEKVLKQENDNYVQDKMANDLIKKYVQEKGMEDGQKTQQLRLDLASRINELAQERDELIRKEGAKGENGNLTSEFQKRFDEINGKMQEIQRAQVALLQQQAEGNDGGEGKGLMQEVDSFVRNLQARGINLAGLDLNNPEDLKKLSASERATRGKLVEDIKDFLKDKPKIDTGGFPWQLLPSVRHFKELREELISEIMFKSFQDESETNNYEVGLYASSNLDILLGFLNLDEPARYKELFTLRSATQFYHTMNSAVVRGNFAHFEDVAQNINYQHFEKMRDINGSGLAMRLFEQGYHDVRAKNKRITQDEIAGLKDFVEKRFRQLNEAGVIKSEFAAYKEDPKMEEWEIQRAIAAGRTFFNITLRAAENIATGQVPMDRRRYTSPPQEDMVRILNWNQWLLTRFGVGEARKGQVFLKMSTDQYQEFLRYKGAKLGLNGITEFGGMDVRKMEDGSQYRTSAIYSGWRLENMAFNKVFFEYKGQRISVQQFRDLPEIKDAVKKIKDRIDKEKKKNPKRDPRDWVTEKDQMEYLEVLRPVLELNYGLSMLIKNGDFGAQDNKLGYLLRTKIWEKIAGTNTPLMLDYLTGIKYSWDEKSLEDLDKKIKDLSEKKGRQREDNIELTQLRKERAEIENQKTVLGGVRAKSIEQLKEEINPRDGWDKEIEITLPSGEKQKITNWDLFKNKVLINFERSIKQARGEELSPLPEGAELTEVERKMEEAIRAEGEKLAPHLADVYFAYTPFMNDMPFEDFRYDVTGQTFYKRRTTGDMGGFNKGQGAFAKIMSNPGGLTAKESIEAMKEIVEGIGSPEGYQAADEANFPIFSALLDVVTTDPGKRMGLVKMLLEGTRQSTSIAQRWAGIKADSFIESEAASLVDDALKLGILTPELAAHLKKKKKLTLKYILWMLFRDVILIPTTAAAVSNFAKAVTAK